MKVNEAKRWFFEKIKLINLWTDPSREKERKESKSMKLETKKEIITNITEIQRDHKKLL